MEPDNLLGLGSDVRSSWGLVFFACLAPFFLVTFFVALLFPAANIGQLYFLPIIFFGAVFGFRGAISASAIAILGITPLYPFLIGRSDYVLVSSSTVLMLGLIVFGLSVALLFGFKVHRNPVGSYQLQEPAPSSSTISGIYYKVLASLANTVEVRDHQTQGHCRRVADNAMTSFAP